MSKSKKIFYIILISLLSCCGIAYIVLYCLYPTNTQRITWQVFDYICNKPLPVIGVSSLVLGIVIFKIVKFAIANKTTKVAALVGKIKELELELSKSKEEAVKKQEEYKKILEYIQLELSGTNDNLRLICQASPNKKIKALGEKFYGKETVDSVSETEEI